MALNCDVGLWGLASKVSIFLNFSAYKSDDLLKVLTTFAVPLLVYTIIIKPKFMLIIHKIVQQFHEYKRNLNYYGMLMATKIIC